MSIFRFDQRHNKELCLSIIKIKLFEKMFQKMLLHNKPVKPYEQCYGLPTWWKLISYQWNITKKWAIFWHLVYFIWNKYNCKSSTEVIDTRKSQYELYSYLFQNICRFCSLKFTFLIYFELTDYSPKCRMLLIIYAFSPNLYWFETIFYKISDINQNIFFAIIFLPLPGRKYFWYHK